LLPSFDYKGGDEFHLWIPLMESRFGIWACHIISLGWLLDMLSEFIAGVAIHMITAISIGVAVGVFLYKTSPVPIPQLSLYVEYVTVWIVSKLI
jgi:hypothetical protein